METASLRLKFTPIFKDILHNNTKCCLEIVPEVSSVQNIDKIEWIQNCDYVEYTIPMTYKIILKKKESEIMDTAEWSKTYHSCVELLTPSSLTNTNYASGDIKRIFSDTFILSSMTSYYEEAGERKINKHQSKSKITNDQGKIVIANTEKKDTRLFVDTLVISDVPLDNIQECLEESNDATRETPTECKLDNKPSYKDIGTEITESYEDIERKIKNHQPELKETNDQGETTRANTEKKDTRLFEDTVESPDMPLDNIEECFEKSNVDSKNDEFSNGKDTTTHETIPKYNIDKKQSYKEIAMEITKSLHKIPLETLRTKVNSKRQLSVTPICSINTNDNSFAETIDVFSLNSVIYRMFGSEIEHRPMCLVPTQEYVANEHIVAYHSRDIEKVKGIRDLRVTTSFYTTNSEGPEARVAEFVKKMEAEILPLKVILNEILAKCATLGFLQNKSIKSIKIDQANTNGIVERQSKSNRVVYTVVFDG